MFGRCGLFNYLSIQQLRGYRGQRPQSNFFWATVFYSDFTVYRDIYRLILKIFEDTKDFQHKYKSTLDQDLKQDRPRVYNFAIYGDKK